MSSDERKNIKELFGNWNEVPEGIAWEEAVGEKRENELSIRDLK